MFHLWDSWMLLFVTRSNIFYIYIDKYFDWFEQNKSISWSAHWSCVVCARNQKEEKQRIWKKSSWLENMFVQRVHDLRKQYEESQIGKHCFKTLNWFFKLLDFVFIFTLIFHWLKFFFRRLSSSYFIHLDRYIRSLDGCIKISSCCDYCDPFQCTVLAPNKLTHFQRAPDNVCRFWILFCIEMHTE